MAENCYLGQVGSYFAFSHFGSKMTRKIKSRENVRQNIGFGLVIFAKYAIFVISTCYRYQSEITCCDKNELMPRVQFTWAFLRMTLNGIRIVVSTTKIAFSSTSYSVYVI